MSHLARAAAVVCRLIAVCVVVSVAAQLLVAAGPGTTAERAARAAGVLPADDSGMPAALRADLIGRVERSHGLDRSLPARLVTSTANLFRLELGRSWRSGAPVGGPLARSLARTAPLVALALIVAILLGVGGATAIALRRRGALVVTAVIAIASVTPPVWLALLAARLTGGSGASALAVLALAALPAAIIGRHAADHLAIALESDWARAARARGLSRERVLLRYGPRELGAELAPLGAGLVGYLLGAAMVIETVFGIRGLGSLLADAAAAGDSPVVVAAATTCALIVSLAAAAGRLFAEACDPRLAEARR